MSGARLIAFRYGIAVLDAGVLFALRCRIALGRAAGRQKRRMGRKTMTDTEQETRVFRRIARLSAALGLNTRFVLALFDEIIDETRSQQR